MTHEHLFDDNHGSLSPVQNQILRSFLRSHRPRNSAPQFTAEIDQAASEMRDTVSGNFNLELETDQEYYALMTGVAVATIKMAELIRMGLPPDVAGDTIRHSLAAMAPDALDSDDRY